MHENKTHTTLKEFELKCQLHVKGWTFHLKNCGLQCIFKASKLVLPFSFHCCESELWYNHCFTKKIIIKFILSLLFLLGGCLNWLTTVPQFYFFKSQLAHSKPALRWFCQCLASWYFTTVYRSLRFTNPETFNRFRQRSFWYWNVWDCLNN